MFYQGCEHFPGDVGDHIAVVVDVNYFALYGVAHHHGAYTKLLAQTGHLTAQHFNGTATAQVAGCLYEYVLGGEGQVIGIQFHGQLKGFFGLTIEKQGEDAVVCAYEEVASMPNCHMRGLRVAFWVNADDVDGARREFGPCIAQYKGGMQVVEGRDGMAYVNYRGIRKLRKDSPFHGGHIMVPCAHIREQGDNRHSFDEMRRRITFDRSNLTGCRLGAAIPISPLTLSEHTIHITAVDPIAVLGPNDANLRLVRSYFPKLNIVARGDELKVIGPAAQADLFIDRFSQVVQHVAKYNELPRKVLDDIMGNGEVAALEGDGEAVGVIVHGNHGLRVKARTPNQQRMVDAVADHDMVFAVGPAGTGKTYTAVALAVRALKDRQVRRIILTRPAVEAGENLGFLPGDLREKLDPYLQPLYDALKDMVLPQKLAEYIETGVIQIAPLAFMRGRTLDHAFVILDEAQNASLPQLKMFLTRMGRDAKFIITGDATQVDLPERVRSGLLPAVEHLRHVKGVAVIDLNEKDVIRHELVTRVIAAFKEIEQGRPPGLDAKDELGGVVSR